MRPDGSVRWVEAQGALRPSDSAEPVEMAGTVLDITARKRVERLLIEEKERALVTLHSIGDAEELLQWVRREYGHGTPSAWTTRGVRRVLSWRPATCRGCR